MYPELTAEQVATVARELKDVVAHPARLALA